MKKIIQSVTKEWPSYNRMPCSKSHVLNKRHVTVYSTQSLHILVAGSDYWERCQTSGSRGKDRCHVTCPDWVSQFCGVFSFHEWATLNVFHNNNDNLLVGLSCSCYFMTNTSPLTTEGLWIREKGRRRRKYEEKRGKYALSLHGAPQTEASLYKFEIQTLSNDTVFNVNRSGTEKKWVRISPSL